MSTNAAPLGATGPDPDEFADFDAASQPRRRTWTLTQLLQGFATLAVLLLLAAVLILAMLGFAAARPDHLIVGTWVPVDHPSIQEIRFDSDRKLTFRFRDHDRLPAYYRFEARSTVRVFWPPDHPPTDPLRLMNAGHPVVYTELLMDSQSVQFTVRFQGREMVTHDTATGQSYRWRRL